jgi:hypothetical protein
MKIAIDLDATMTMYPRMFTVFAQALRSAGHIIYIVTDRVLGTESEVMAMLDDLEIGYDFVKITSDKASYIREQGIEVLFDDTDRYFLELPAEVAVLKVRGHYNFDYVERKWIYTEESGRPL